MVAAQSADCAGDSNHSLLTVHVLTISSFILAVAVVWYPFLGKRISIWVHVDVVRLCANSTFNDLQNTLVPD